MGQVSSCPLVGLVGERLHLSREHAGIAQALSAQPAHDEIERESTDSLWALLPVAL
jgi:hypothetical protein